MDLNLAGRRALVTGSTAGIGLAIARELALLGATVAVNGRGAERVTQAIAQLQGEVKEGRFIAAPGDVGSAKGSDAVLKALPEVDILVNNAGIYEPKPFFEIPDEDWRRFFDVNVLSGVRLSRALVPGMVSRGWGRVVFISSESGLQIPVEMVHYGMTKTAQLAIARGLAETVAGSGVTVNSVLPGPDPVGRSRRVHQADGEGRQHRSRRRRPRIRQGAPPDLAARPPRQRRGGRRHGRLYLQSGGERDERRGLARRRRRGAHHRLRRVITLRCPPPGRRPPGAAPAG